MVGLCSSPDSTGDTVASTFSGLVCSFFFFEVLFDERLMILCSIQLILKVCVCVLGIPLLWGTFFQVRTKTKGILRLSIL